MWRSLFFIKVDFFLPQITQFDKSINPFCLVFLTFEFRCQYMFYNWRNTFLLLLVFRQYYFNNKLSSSWIFILSDLNSNLNNLVEISFIRVFLADCLMCLNISLISLLIFKSSLSGSILINLQSSCCSIAFCFFISWSIFLSLCSFLSIYIASL